MDLELFNNIAVLSSKVESGRSLFDYLVKYLSSKISFDEVVFSRIHGDTCSGFMVHVKDKTRLHRDYSELMTERFSIHEGIDKQVLESNGPLIFDTDKALKEYPNINYLKFSKKIGIQSFLAMKVQAGKKNLGFFYLMSHQKGQFSQKDLAIIEDISSALSLAFSNILFRYRFKQIELDQKFQLSINSTLLTARDFRAISSNLAQIISTRIDSDLMALTCLTNSDDIAYEIVKKVGEKFTSVTEQFEDAIDLGKVLEEKRVYIENAKTKIYKADEFDQVAKTSLSINRKRALFGIKNFLQFVLPVINNQKMVLTLGRVSSAKFLESDLETIALAADQISLQVERIMSRKSIEQLALQLETQREYLTEEIKRDHNFTQIIGSSDAIHEVFMKISQVAPTSSTVLITGETGTGKELIARAVHNLSDRSEKPFVKINMAAIPESLIESELFGHEKGSFTGALTQKIGKFEIANGGTIFLDEIGEMPLALQVKLLRVLQEQEIERIGGLKTVKLDVRIIAATNRDLLAEVYEKNFREDLFYRLNVFPVHLPALRERKQDIKALVEHFVEKYSKKLGKQNYRVDQMMLQGFMMYDWPGNIRELEHLVEKSMILANGHLVLASPVLKGGDKVQEIEEGNMTLDQVQKAYISRILDLTDGKIRGEGGAAHKLGMKPTTLESRMKKLGLKKETTFKYE